MSEDPEDRPPLPWWRHPIVRLVALAALLVGLWSLGRQTGFDRYADVNALRTIVDTYGAWGVAIFVGIWIVGMQMQLPGFLFIIAAILIFGPIKGAIISWGGGVLVLIVTYFVIRGVGGQPLARVKRPFVRKALDALDSHPIRSVAILRTFLIMNPLINYSLILSGVSFRHHTIGSAIGLIGPIIFWTILLETFGRPLLNVFVQ